MITENKRLAIDIIVIVLQIILIIISLSIRERIIPSFTFVKSIINNWEKGPVVDLYSSKSRCIKNHKVDEIYKLSEYNLNCKTNLTTDYVDPISEISQNTYIPFYQLIGVQDNYICTNRGNHTYFELRNISNCDKYNSCGVLDSLNNDYCFENCFYNNIELKPNSDSKSNFMVNNIYGIELNKENNKKFQPIVDITVHNETNFTSVHNCELTNTPHNDPYNITFDFKGYIGWSTKCLEKKFDNDMMNRLYNEYLFIYESTEKISISISVFFTMFVFIIALDLLIFNKEKSPSKHLLMFMNFVLLNFVVVNSLMRSISKSWYLTDYLIENDNITTCSDSFTNQRLFEAIQINNYLVFGYTFSVFIHIALWSLPLWAFVYSNVKKIDD